ncbi:MAG: bifunctional precorrin-2 dehydrogenase/sirohydrochlorin ferrochelatase [Desulfobulbus oligotrophicus]|nr:bifunctional precorrin-2 dehydrogenase/sirohydrochlorin ferrochelatase [Desulfobulbus oligotrophicus]
MNISGRLCVVVGGGLVAERKVGGILNADGLVRVVSPVVTPGLATLAEHHTIEWLQKDYSQPDLDGALLVFAATNNSHVQQAVCRDARMAGLLINVADTPEACDFQVPAVVRRGELTLGVATNGASPAVAAMVRRRLEQEFGEVYGVLTVLAGLIRVQLLAEGRESGEVKLLFEKILCDDIVQWLQQQRWSEVQQHVENILGWSPGMVREVLNKVIS